MLDQETRRKIDSARQVLVGKIPDPKAQVEQITTALIYKFMDDMDKESEELGGKARFFADHFKRYSWTNLLDPKLSGEERSTLYLQAISNMPHNPDIPQLFRDIFKGAFLPFRDARILNLFLKEIDGFSYENSENLGNAFEYLLSILGSQGDAGQFRTPRHIIDFIVEVLDPQIAETILDPACGTAGFLISAYKHVLKNNSSNFDPQKDPLPFEHTDNTDLNAFSIQNNGKYKGDKLDPQVKIALTQSLVGYDIAPDMVKLALVNLYLHDFTEPKIFEYDTLTSDQKWGETFDLILANPPFMTPKGGIQPHNRFSVHANRAEVLFVDYIAEHLNVKGRAGIIVPEGIIFQAAKAYKSLRKNLLENWGLYAVVSLPSGVFQPYSGVKTSILFLDRTLAKKTDTLLFLKVEHDGFDLGAQRRKIAKNDLPTCFHLLKHWQKDPTIEENSKIALAVKKAQIAKDGDYNLTGDRYRATVDYRNVKWEMVALGEVLEYEQPTNYLVENTKYSNEYKTPVLTAGKSFLLGYTNEKNGIFSTEKLPVIIFDDFTTAIKFVDFPFKVKSSAMKILSAKEKNSIKFIFYMMQKIDFDASQHKRYWISQYSKIKIPLPPLAVQQQIVAEIEQYQKVIDGAKQVIQNYKPSFYIDPEWEMVALGEVLEYEQPTNYLVENTKYSNEYKTPVLTAGKSFLLGYTNEKNGIFSTEKLPVIIFDDFTTAIKFVDFPFKVKSSAMKILSAKEKNSIKFIFYMMQKIDFDASQHKRYWISQYSKIKIPLPPLAVQQQIVAEIEAEQKAIEECKKLIEKMEAKIKRKIGEVWGQ